MLGLSIRVQWPALKVTITNNAAVLLPGRHYHFAVCLTVDIA